MSGRCLSRSLRVRAAQTGIRPQAHTSLYSPRRSSILSNSLNSSHSSPQLSYALSSSFPPSDYYQQLRLANLEYALESEASPFQLWSAYSGLVGIAGGDFIPLDIHQKVLRRCWPSTSFLRQSIARGLEQGRLPEVADFPEERFHTVLRNIRSIGLQPTLGDFNTILEKFAIVGHYQGCWEIYKDLKRHGCIPSQTTFGYCFQSIAYRFSLPIPKASRETIAVITQDMFSTYMADMRTFHVPMNPVTFDLSIRILKETLDREGFENLMRWGYALDLSNPDRLALELSDPSHVGPDGSRLVPFPFTTTALNTTIDVLGRLGDIPKMIQAFEVLTQPLPYAREHFFSSFESDESDDYGVKVTMDYPTHVPLPHAKPNTSTYNIMLRYICRADHAVFTRHYLNHARMLDRQTAHTLRNDVQHARSNKKPLEEIPSPRMNINAGMLLPILGQGNKDKNLGLLKWLQSKMPIILRKCKTDLDYFHGVLEEVKQERLAAFPNPELNKPLPPPVLDLDIRNPPPPEQTFVKPFNIDLHVRILSRNYGQIVDFDKRLSFIVGRTHERVKERLGRRIWQNKGVFFRHDCTRSIVSKERWRNIVNFHPKNDSYLYRSKPKPWVPDKIEQPRRRNMSTICHRRLANSIHQIHFPHYRYPNSLDHSFIY